MFGNFNGFGHCFCGLAGFDGYAIFFDLLPRSILLIGFLFFLPTYPLLAQTKVILLATSFSLIDLIFTAIKALARGALLSLAISRSYKVA